VVPAKEEGHSDHFFGDICLDEKAEDEGEKKEGDVEEEEEVMDEAEKGKEEEEEEEEEEPCAVCLGAFEETEVVEEAMAVMILRCGHRFHRSCVGGWKMACRTKGTTATCPMCRGLLVEIHDVTV